MSEILINETTKPAASSLTWFEIPCIDIERAAAFYFSVLGRELIDHTDDCPMRIFPADEGAMTGALVVRPGMQPNANGTVVYLRCDGDIDDAMARVAPAGGTVITPKMSAPGVDGEFFVLRDSEGNSVGLHQQPAG